MKNIIHIFVFFSLFICSTLFIACTSSEDLENEPPKVTEEELKDSKQTWNDIHQYVEQHGLNNIDEVLQYIKNSIGGVRNVTKEGKKLIIVTSAGLKMSLSFTSYPHYKTAQFSEAELNSMMNTFASSENLPVADESARDTRNSFADELWTLQTSNGIYRRNAAKENNTVNRVSRSTSDNKVRLSRKNVAVWCPWRNFYDFEHDEDYIKECVQKVNKDGNIWTFNDFSPASFASWGDFDMVVVSAHGDEEGNLLIPIDSTFIDLDAYSDEWNAGRVWIDESVFQIAPNKWAVVPSIVLSKSFYDKYLPKLTNTIIYTITCFAGKEKGEFMTSVMSKDVADYFGSDIQCTSENILKEFSNYYPKLSKGVASHKAFAKGKGYINGNVTIRDNETGMDVAHQYKYSQYGKKTVCYHVPFALGIVNNSGSKTKSTESGDGASVVVKSQVRCDKSVRSSLNNIGAGICLKNMTSKEVEYIPFSSSNVVSSTIADYNETSVRTVETKLTDLSLGDDYMYCTYVKNGNETILSDECYQILSLCPDNNHPHAIDMAEAGVWACCNVGATSPEEYGGYYAWGETAEKSDYSDDTYKFYKSYKDEDGTKYGYTKYCNNELFGYGCGRYKNSNWYYYKEGFIDNLMELVPSDDVASVKWGGSWRMPTRARLEALRDKCTHKWTQVNDVNGMMFTASNGNRIFFPAAGGRYGSSLLSEGGDYWSSSLNESYPDCAYSLYFYSGGVYVYSSFYYRYYGRSVRPVRP